LEQRIEQNYLGEGYQSQQLETKNAVILHSFRSKGTASKDSDQHIALYFVEVTPFINTAVADTETDLYKISTGLYFSFFLSFSFSFSFSCFLSLFPFFLFPLLFLVPLFLFFLFFLVFLFFFS